jgi:hypothetical protein
MKKRYRKSFHHVAIYNKQKTAHQDKADWGGFDIASKYPNWWSHHVPLCIILNSRGFNTRFPHHSQLERLTIKCPV